MSLDNCVGIIETKILVAIVGNSAKVKAWGISPTTLRKE